uniref:Trefoil factor 2 n=1 Tax=Equus caballus TaxID=9796 RepID=F6QHI0_HORSE
MGQLEERGWGRSPSSCSPSILTFSWGHLAICAPSFQKVSLLFFTNKIISAKPFQFLRRMLHSSNTGKTRLGSFPCGSRTDGGVRNVSREQVGSECGEWLTEGLSAAPCRCSRIEPNERDNCGFPGITSDQCFASGCCFNSSIRGVPWCFTPLPKQELEECVMEVSDRENCGYPGISPEECASRKCCFSDDITQVPWCFFPISVEDCHY